MSIISKHNKYIWPGTFGVLDYGDGDQCGILSLNRKFQGSKFSIVIIKDADENCLRSIRSLIETCLALSTFITHDIIMD